MRTNANTKREKAISSAVLGVMAAQIRCEAEHACMGEAEAAELEELGRAVEAVAESLFVQSQPKGSRWAQDSP